jgi:prevent-host-death family protein
MRRATAAQARQHFAELLDAAERGEQVIIERRGIRFVLAPQRRRSRPKRMSLLEILDPAVESGQWTWEAGPKGIRFAARPARRRG